MAEKFAWIFFKHDPVPQSSLILVSLLVFYSFIQIFFEFEIEGPPNFVRIRIEICVILGNVIWRILLFLSPIRVSVRVGI